MSGGIVAPARARTKGNADCSPPSRRACSASRAALHFEGTGCSGGEQALFLIVASRYRVLGKVEEGCVLGRRCRPNRRAFVREPKPGRIRGHFISMPRRSLPGRERSRWTAPESSRSFGEGLFISAAEGEGPGEEARGREGTERSRRKACCSCGCGC